MCQRRACVDGIHTGVGEKADRTCYSVSSDDSVQWKQEGVEEAWIEQVRVDAEEGGE